MMKLIPFEYFDNLLFSNKNLKLFKMESRSKLLSNDDLKNSLTVQRV